MKLLKCLLCKGEIDVIGNERATNKKVKCQSCGFSNQEEKPQPEVMILRKRLPRFKE